MPQPSQNTLQMPIDLKDSKIINLSNIKPSNDENTVHKDLNEWIEQEFMQSGLNESHAANDEKYHAVQNDKQLSTSPPD